MHSVIFKKDDKIYIMDKGSKFGTLLYLNSPFTLSLNENDSLDVKNKTLGSSKLITKNVHNNSSVFQQSCLSKNINAENTYFINNNQNENFNFPIINKQEKNISKIFYGNEVNLVAGKNLFNFKIVKTWNLFGGIFSKAFCCKYKTSTNDEFIIDLENDLRENMKEIANSKNPRENNLLMSENNSYYFNSNVGNNANNAVKKNHFQDSYLDYYLNIDTIIRQTENNFDEENQGENDSHSFL